MNKLSRLQKAIRIQGINPAAGTWIDETGAWWTHELSDAGWRLVRNG